MNPLIVEAIQKVRDAQECFDSANRVLDAAQSLCRDAERAQNSERICLFNAKNELELLICNTEVVL